MFRPVMLCLLLLTCVSAAPAGAESVPAPFAPALPAPALELDANAADFTAAPAPAPAQLATALVMPYSDTALIGESALRLPGLHRKPRAPRPERATMPLGPERTRILLRSLTVPGWGQATLGRRHAAAVFAVAEAGVWTAFASFRVQEILRRIGYEKTATIFAGIDLHGRDDEYRRIVGSFSSSDEYNLYVVSRDAANIYLTDPSHPDLTGYHAYVAAHSLSGADGWHWTDRASFDRYREERKNSQRAGARANGVLGLAIANRLVSAVLAMRQSGHPIHAAGSATSWKFEVRPGDLAEPGSFRAGLHATF